MITKEMVEIAASAYLGVRDYESYRDCIRAALEAVEPALIAQGMREAAKVADDFDIEAKGKFDHLNTIDNMNVAVRIMMDKLRDTLLARAQELDPQ